MNVSEHSYKDKGVLILTIDGMLIKAHVFDETIDHLSIQAENLNVTDKFNLNKDEIYRIEVVS